MRFKRLVAVLAVMLGLSTVGWAQPAFMTNGLVAFYPFNGNANDESGNGRNGVVVGASVGKDRFGNDQRCYSFTGSGQYIEVTNSLHPKGNASVTYSCWLTWPDVVAHRPQFIHNVGTWDGSWFVNGSRSGIGFDAGEGGAPLMATWTAQSTSWVGFDVSKIAPNQWHHLVVTKGPYSIDFYIDGQPFGHQSLPVSQDVISTDLFIGCSLPGLEQFYGFMDDLRVYNRILSNKEVGDLYAYESVNPVPHPASATAQVVNGFVVGLSITDPGFGYTNSPVVMIEGGGGSGATAVAVVANGIVSQLKITNAGIGYTSAPEVAIASPPFMPWLNMSVRQVDVTQHVILGHNYVLEVSTNLVNWTQVGSQFTAYKETITQTFDVKETGRFFRISEVP